MQTRSLHYILKFSASHLHVIYIAAWFSRPLTMVIWYNYMVIFFGIFSRYKRRMKAIDFGWRFFRFLDPRLACCWICSARCDSIYASSFSLGMSSSLQTAKATSKASFRRVRPIYADNAKRTIKIDDASLLYSPSIEWNGCNTSTCVSRICRRIELISVNCRSNYFTIIKVVFSIVKIE